MKWRFSSIMLLCIFVLAGFTTLVAPEVQAGVRHRTFRHSHHGRYHRHHHHHWHRPNISGSLVFRTYVPYPSWHVYYTAPEPVYVGPPYRVIGPPNVDVKPQVAPHNEVACLQEREYQTKIIIDGTEVDAYGTACLQPDGSWRRGPANLAR